MLSQPEYFKMWNKDERLFWQIPGTVPQLIIGSRHLCAYMLGLIKVEHLLFENQESFCQGPTWRQLFVLVL